MRFFIANTILFLNILNSYFFVFFKKYNNLNLKKSKSLYSNPTLFITYILLFNPSVNPFENLLFINELHIYSSQFSIVSAALFLSSMFYSLTKDIQLISWFFTFSHYDEVLTFTYKYVILNDLTLIPINDVMENRVRDYPDDYYLSSFTSMSEGIYEE